MKWITLLLAVALALSAALAVAGNACPVNLPTCARGYCSGDYCGCPCLLPSGATDYQCVKCGRRMRNSVYAFNTVRGSTVKSPLLGFIKRGYLPVEREEIREFWTLLYAWHNYTVSGTWRPTGRAEVYMVWERAVDVKQSYARAAWSGSTTYRFTASGQLWWEGGGVISGISYNVKPPSTLPGSTRFDYHIYSGSLKGFSNPTAVEGNGWYGGWAAYDVAGGEVYVRFLVQIQVEVAQRPRPSNVVVSARTVDGYGVVTYATTCWRTYPSILYCYCGGGGPHCKGTYDFRAATPYTVYEAYGFVSEFPWIAEGRAVRLTWGWNSSEPANSQGGVTSGVLSEVEAGVYYGYFDWELRTITVTSDPINGSRIVALKVLTSYGRAAYQVEVEELPGSGRYAPIWNGTGSSLFYRLLQLNGRRVRLRIQTRGDSARVTAAAMELVQLRLKRVEVYRGSQPVLASTANNTGWVDCDGSPYTVVAVYDYAQPPAQLYSPHGPYSLPGEALYVPLWNESVGWAGLWNLTVYEAYTVPEHVSARVVDESTGRHRALELRDGNWLLLNMTYAWRECGAKYVSEGFYPLYGKALKCLPLIVDASPSLRAELQQLGPGPWRLASLAAWNPDKSSWDTSGWLPNGTTLYVYLLRWVHINGERKPMLQPVVVSTTRVTGVEPVYAVGKYDPSRQYRQVSMKLHVYADWKYKHSASAEARLRQRLSPKERNDLRIDVNPVYGKRYVVAALTVGDSVSAFGHAADSVKGPYVIRVCDDTESFYANPKPRGINTELTLARIELRWLIRTNVPGEPVDHQEAVDVWLVPATPYVQEWSEGSGLLKVNAALIAFRKGEVNETLPISFKWMLWVELYRDAKPLAPYNNVLYGPFTDTISISLPGASTKDLWVGLYATDVTVGEYQGRRAIAVVVPAVYPPRA